MATVESLLVRVEAETSKLRSELNKAERATAKFEQQVNRAIGGVIRTIVGLGSVAALTAFGRSALNTADQIAKSADRIGIGTDALQKYRYAAGLAGADSKTLESSLEKLNKRLGEAAAGNKEAAAEFMKLGISIKSGNGDIRATEEVFRDLADRLAAMKDPAERTRAAMKLMEEGGAGLIVMLRGGSAALDAAAKEAEKLGLVIEEKLLRQAEQTSDQLSKVAQVIGTKFTRAALEAAPYVDAFATGLLGLTEHMDEIARVAEAAAAGLAVLGGAAVLNSIGNAVAAVGGLTAATKGLTAAAMANPFLAAATAVAAATSALLYYGDELRAVLSGTSELSEAERQHAAFMSSLNQHIAEASGLSRDAARAKLEEAIAVREATKAKLGEAAAEIERKRAELLTSRGSPTGAAAKALAGAYGDRKAIITEIDKIDELIAGLNDRLAGLGKTGTVATGNLAGGFYLLAEAAGRLGEGYDDAFMRIEKLTAWQREYNSGLDVEAEMLLKSLDPQFEYRREVERLMALKPALVRILGDEAKAQEILNRAIRDADPAYQQAERAAEERAEAMRAAAKAVEAAENLPDEIAAHPTVQTLFAEAFT